MAEYMIQGDTLTAIADAIREKIESTTKIKPTEMAALIEGISGLPDIAEKFACGSTTLTSPNGSISFTHNFGEKPHFILVLAADVSKQTYESNKMPIVACMAYLSPGNSVRRKVLIYKSSSSGYSQYMESYTSTTDEENKVIFGTDYTSRKFTHHTPYLWFCGTLKDFV